MLTSASRVLVLGLGREGQASIRYLRESNASLSLAIADRLPLDQLDDTTRSLLRREGIEDLHLGPDYLGCLTGYDVIVRAPGIPPFLPEIERAVANGAVLTSNTRLFFDVAPGLVIGITGTKGKSTTTSLIHHVLARGGGDFRLGGNIGIAPTECLAGATANTTFVLELSCHQLCDLDASPDIAVVQDVVPEHLDYYRSFGEYVRAKQNIVLHQRPDDVIVFNSAYAIPRAFADSTPAQRLAFSLDGFGNDACFLRDGTIYYQGEGLPEAIMPGDAVPLVGRFNLQNVMPAIIIGKRFGLATKTIRGAVETFHGLQHRLEFIADIDGARYYNDSLATVPEATIGAVQSFPAGSVVLIAGGYDRGQDYGELAQALLAADLRGLILLPETGARLWHEIERAKPSHAPESRFVEGMQEAILAARELAQPGDAVLLSPAAASFGAFRDYADRGNKFREAVLSLATQPKTP